MRVHGGRWADYLETKGALPLDFSSNVSPLGMPACARIAASVALETADRYPDPECRELRHALAKCHGLPPDDILCGNGAGDLIDRLALAARPREVLVTAPTFGEYRAAFERVGSTVREWTLAEGDDFLLGEAFLGHITEGTGVVVLCEPNNPTGKTTDAALLAAVVERCQTTGTLLVVDECFLDFVDDGAKKSLLRRVRTSAMGARILVLRAFTKFYGMAGLRLGWCASRDQGLLSAMADAGQPWPVSAVAQAAGVAALADEGYAQKLRALIARERPHLAVGLGALGCRVVPGEANYLLFYAERNDLSQQLEMRGILIRDCRDYAGLGPGWYRVAVRTREEDDRLLRAMEGVLR